MDPRNNTAQEELILDWEEPTAEETLQVRRAIWRHRIGKRTDKEHHHGSTARSTQRPFSCN